MFGDRYVTGSHISYLWYSISLAHEVLDQRLCKGLILGLADYFDGHVDCWTIVTLRTTQEMVQGLQIWCHGTKLWGQEVTGRK